MTRFRLSFRAFTTAGSLTKPFQIEVNARDKAGRLHRIAETSVKQTNVWVPVELRAINIPRNTRAALELKGIGGNGGTLLLDDIVLMEDRLTR